MNGLGKRPKDFVFFILILVIVNGFLVNGLLYLINRESSIFPYSYHALFGQPAHADSWDPMNRGLKSFRSGEDVTIYQKVFFNQKHKFQYPPTSLLILEVAQRLVNQEEALRIILDRISWVCAIGTIMLSGLIFRAGIRQYVPGLSNRVIWLSVVFFLGLGFTFYPVLRSYYLGQIQTWINFLFTASLYYWLFSNQKMSGFSIGIISVIKPQMGLYFFWGLAKRYYKFCIVLGCVAASFIVVSILRYGWAAHLKYLDVLSYIASRGEAYYPNQSVNGLMNRLLFNGNNLDWSSSQFAPPNELVNIVTLTTSAILIMGLIGLNFLKNTDDSESWIGYSIAGLVFTIASPVAWEHHYGILLPIFALAFPKVWSLRDSWKNGLVWLVLGYLLTSNLWLFTNHFYATGWNFLQSYLFFGALIVMGVLLKMQLSPGKNQITNKTH
jgi:hypothetical protein